MNFHQYQSKSKKNEVDEIKHQCKIENIKSKYILSQIFDKLKEVKSLKIIQHNKNIQNRLNISINDYKRYGYIEIELIPSKNEFGKFINIPDKEETYYHIYFNNKKKESKRHYLNENDRIIIIKIMINYHVKNYNELFKECKCIESMRFNKFYNQEIISMKGMFYNCSSLKQLDLSNFITDSVTDMSYMFYKCLNIKNLNVSSFNTNNVVDMCNMFSECSSLNELNLSNLIRLN